jgi:hypothetical protein
MLKRFVMIGLLGISVIGMLRTAEAHYIPTLSGWAWHSVECIVDLKSVPSPTTHPALTECVVNTALVEVLCRNPASHEVAPGRSARRVTLVTQEQLEEGNITNKKKGLAHVEVTVSDEPLLNPEFCVNRNWIPIDVLIREMAAEINTYECTGPAGNECGDGFLNLASTVTANCVLPAEINFDDYPDNLPPEGTDVQYECTNKVTEHVD